MASTFRPWTTHVVILCLALLPCLVGTYPVGPPTTPSYYHFSRATSVGSRGVEGALRPSPINSARVGYSVGSLPLDNFNPTQPLLEGSGPMGLLDSGGFASSETVDLGLWDPGSLGAGATHTLIAVSLFFSTALAMGHSNQLIIVAG